MARIAAKVMRSFQRLQTRYHTQRNELGLMSSFRFSCACEVCPVSGFLSDPAHVSREIDLSQEQPLQSNQPSSSVDVIDRRSVADLSTMGDNVTGFANPRGIHDQSYNLKIIEAAYVKLPHPKDSESARAYTPAPINDSPAFWSVLVLNNMELIHYSFHFTIDRCQRIKKDFSFEYNYLEDELNV